MEYINNIDLEKEINELSKESIKDLMEHRDMLAYEILQNIKKNRKNIKELRNEIDDILKLLPEDKNKRMNEILNEYCECMSKKKLLRDKLFGLGEDYESEINKQIDILEKYGLSAKVNAAKITANPETYICKCEDCKTRFNTKEKTVKECPYCGSQKIVCCEFE